MDEVRIDCRVMFRLHTLDLPLPRQDQRNVHWMLLRGSGFRSILAEIARDYGRLRRAGADPLQGLPITGAAVVCCLGLEEREQPRGIWNRVKFAASVLAAALRESVQVQRELAYLAQHNGSRS